MWEWILRRWDNVGRNIKLDYTEFIDVDPLSGDSRFNIEACTVKSLFKWLPEAFFKK